ncbi:hypothetical protein EBT16_03950 [bacterium]|nr:hypothetical protein [bacterium]
MRRSRIPLRSFATGALLVLVTLGLVLPLVEAGLARFWSNPYQTLDRPSEKIPLYPGSLHVSLRTPELFGKAKRISLDTNFYRSLHRVFPGERTSLAIGSMTTSNEILPEEERWVEKIHPPAINYGYRGVGLGLSAQTIRFVQENVPINFSRILILSGLTDIRCFADDNCENSPPPSVADALFEQGESYFLGEPIRQSALYSFLFFHFTNLRGFSLNESALFTEGTKPVLSQEDYIHFKNRVISTLLPQRNLWLKRILSLLKPSTELILLTQPNNYSEPLNPGQDLRNFPSLPVRGSRYRFSHSQIAELLMLVNQQSLSFANAQANLKAIDTGACVTSHLKSEEISWKGQFSQKGNAVFAACVDQLLGH